MSGTDQGTSGTMQPSTPDDSGTMNSGSDTMEDQTNPSGGMQNPDQ